MNPNNLPINTMGLQTRMLPGFSCFQALGPACGPGVHIRQTTHWHAHDITITYRKRQKLCESFAV